MKIIRNSINCDVPIKLSIDFQIVCLLYRFTYVALLMQVLSVTAPEDDLCVDRNVEKKE